MEDKIILKHLLNDKIYLGRDIKTFNLEEKKVTKQIESSDFLNMDEVLLLQDNEYIFTVYSEITKNLKEKFKDILYFYSYRVPSFELSLGGMEYPTFGFFYKLDNNEILNLEFEKDIFKLFFENKKNGFLIETKLSKISFYDNDTIKSLVTFYDSTFSETDLKGYKYYNLVKNCLEEVFPDRKLDILLSI